MAYCSKCGEQVNSTMTFCSGCGEKMAHTGFFSTPIKEHGVSAFTFYSPSYQTTSK